MNKILTTPISNISINTNDIKDFYVMALESSCDETACAIVKNGREVIANTVASQIETHKTFGGVVPEVAAREHLDAVNLVIEETFQKANMSGDEISAFSATVGPGLVGCLLVGLNAAKSLAIAYDKPFIGINHLNAHVCANYIDTELKPPFMALLVSGGHTQIIHVKSYEEQEILGGTIDDAVGEAYDKVARLIGLPYPGGVHLDKLAQIGNKTAYSLPTAKVGEFEFSFSGLKTAVLREVKNQEKPLSDEFRKDISASFQENVSKVLITKLENACKKFNIKTVVLAGGVAANSEIRNKAFELQNKGYKVYAPQMKYCTDNAAMVASAAYFMSNTYNNLDVEVFSRSK